MSFQEMKALAKEQIKGKIGILFVISLIIGVVVVAVEAVSMFIPVIGSWIPALLTPAFSLSLVTIYLNLAKGIHPQVKDAFAGFNDWWTAFKISFFVGLYTFLWSLLFIIPGIIKAFSYSQSYLIAAEHPGIPANEAITRSKDMMEGHKWDCFVLSLSFLGWMLLTVLTFGILGIWTLPYMNATFVNFYNAIKPYEEVSEDNGCGYSLDDAAYASETQDDIVETDAAEIVDNTETE